MSIVILLCIVVCGVWWLGYGWIFFDMFCWKYMLMEICNVLIYCWWNCCCGVVGFVYVEGECFGSSCVVIYLNIFWICVEIVVLIVWLVVWFWEMKVVFWCWFLLVLLFWLDCCVLIWDVYILVLVVVYLCCVVGWWLGVLICWWWDVDWSCLILVWVLCLLVWCCLYMWFGFDWLWIVCLWFWYWEIWYVVCRGWFSELCIGIGWVG